MNLFYVANIRFPTERAHGIQIAKMCEAFARKGVDVRLIVPRRSNHIKEDPFSYYGVEENFKVIKVFSLDLDMGRFGSIGFRTQALSFILSALWHIVLGKPDSVYSRDIFFAYLVSVFKKRVVFEDHEPPSSKRQLYAFFLRHIRKKVIVAENLVALYKDYRIPPKSFIVAPNGVDIEEFDDTKPDRSIWERTFGIAPGVKIVLYIGHFYPWKGVYILGESASFVPANTAVVLIGATVENRVKMHSFVSERKLSNVYIHDFVPHREVLTYIKSADVLVLPNTAQEERSREYTTPIKLFEYMASGVPIVASNIPSFGSYLKNGKNALMCEPDNSKDLADKITRLLQGKERGASLARTARADVRAFSWEERARKIIDFVSNV